MLDLILQGEQEENQLLKVYTNRVLMYCSVLISGSLRTAWIFPISGLRSNVQHDGGKFNAVRNRYANVNAFACEHLQLIQTRSTSYVNCIWERGTVPSVHCYNLINPDCS